MFKLFVEFLLGMLGVPLVDWLKAKLGWSNGKVVLLVGLVAGVLAALELFIGGQLGFEDFNMDQLAYSLAAIFLAAQVWYKFLVYRAKAAAEKAAVG